jgi:hypothetical protein
LLSEGAILKRDKRAPLPSSINTFIQKTYAILQEKQFESVVSWADHSGHLIFDPDRPHELSSEGAEPSGRRPSVCSFKIHNLRAFEEIVLPKYFKHSNMSSFVRQVRPSLFSSTCTVSTRSGATRTRSSSNTKNSSGTGLICLPKSSASRSTPPTASPPSPSSPRRPQSKPSRKASFSASRNSGRNSLESLFRSPTTPPIKEKAHPAKRVQSTSKFSEWSNCRRQIEI